MLDSDCTISVHTLNIRMTITRHINMLATPPIMQFTQTPSPQARDQSLMPTQFAPLLLPVSKSHLTQETHSAVLAPRGTVENVSPYLGERERCTHRLAWK
jgi:hypothetical protein